MRIRGFKLFLVASCFAVATAAWLTTISRPERVAISAIAIGAAVLLLVVARSDSADLAPESNIETQPGSADSGAATVEAHATAEADGPRSRGGRRARNARRLLELEGRLDGISEQLKTQEQRVADISEMLRRIETDGSEALVKLARRFDELEAVNVEQRDAVHEAHEQHREHVDRLQLTIAAHKQGITALGQVLEDALTQ